MPETKMHPLEVGDKRLTQLGFDFIDVGCYEHPNGKVLQLGNSVDGLLIRPLCPGSMEPTAPSYLCENPAEFEQALLLLGAVPIVQ
jgi:hypothetical protein